MYIALGAAWVATCGSLYMSEALGWKPCPLCWYQRICMYSSAVVIAIGLVNHDRHTPKYSLVLALIGAFIAINHVLEQKLPGFAVLPPCSNDVPCTLDPMNAFGWLTIPMLALTAFVVIIIGSVIALRANANDNNALTEAPTSIFSPLPSVLLIVLMVVALFGVTGTITRNARLTRESALANLPAADSAAVIYAASCQQCHGPANVGIDRKSVV